MVDFPTIVSSRRRVPNEFPIREPDSYRIALIGESPGEDEENHRRPFVGKSGQFLTNILNDVGIDRTKCLVGNICQFRPPGNRIESFDWNGPEIQDGLEKLREDILLYNPNIVVALGNTPLRAARGPCKITDWRGSLFQSSAPGSPFMGRKIIGSLHPAFVLREFSGFPLLKFDLKRAADEGKSPTLDLPKRELITNYDADILCYILDTWPNGQRCSLDIEGGLGGWPCVSICGRPTKSITIAWGKLTPDNHAKVIRSFATLMARPTVPKVLQNSLYDNFVLSFGFGIPIRGVVEDTMLKGWEVYCELPKGLGTQTSIWTREPFYKADRKSDNPETFFEYCAKDSAVTLEICNNQDNVLTGSSLTHYRKNVEMLNPLLYMELRGIKYDQENVTKELEETRTEINEIGDKLVQCAGKELRGAKGSLSSKRLAECLYIDKKYPPQYKKEFGRKTEKLTTNVEALLNLRRKLPNDEFLNNILQHRHLEGILETLQIKPDPDGRVRCGYNVVGTETGRLTCYTSPTGAGANLQTITKKLRKNYVADEGFDFFQCDLAGADGWTVAAHCKRLGDTTMLEDYQAGLKPAKILALLYAFGADVNELDRDSLTFWCNGQPWKEILVATSHGIYDCTKMAQHGSSYMMGVPTMIVNIMKKSYKETGIPIYMEHRDGTILQGLFFRRYHGLPTYHSWAESKLVADGTLVSASGQKRIFFGRRFGTNIHDTVKEFLAHEPQSNTTWATNLAMLNLWNDPDNRCPDGSLIIEPLHQVHDALCGQWPQSVREWARSKVKTYFNNTLTIAGIDIVIPFEGRYGRSWGELTEEI